MMNYTGWEIPEGKVVKVEDASGRVIWAVDTGFDGTFKVAKITSDTYAGSTTYTGEEFILLDVYPETNGTVHITYEGVTKTITDTSGAEEPNAQQVFFGTFNGVSDEVETPASGIVTITGDLRGVGCGSYSKDNKGDAVYASCITAIGDMTGWEVIPNRAFSACSEITTVNIPNSIEAIGDYAFYSCKALSSAVIPNGVKSIGSYAFSHSSVARATIPGSVTSIGTAPWRRTNDLGKGIPPDLLAVDGSNTVFKMDSKCLVNVHTNTLIMAMDEFSIPDYVEIIGDYACNGAHSRKITMGTAEVTVPASVKSIGVYGLYGGLYIRYIMLGTTPPTLAEKALFATSNVEIIVPVGCAEAYKAESGWSTYADYIVEES